jgi:hypothetical protein
MVVVEPLLRLLNALLSQEVRTERAESDSFLSDSLDGEHTTNLQEVL